MTMRKCLAGIVAIGVAFALLPATAAATSLQVTSLTDVGNAGSLCTLREAITSASNDGVNFGNGCGIGNDPDTISFDPALFTPAGQQTITVTGTTLTIFTSSLTITGPGAGELALDGQDLLRPLSITSGTIGISGLTVQNGSITGTQPEGGGIFNAANLTLTGVVVSGNTASATAPPATFTAADGGGIYNFSSGDLTLDHSAVVGNEALDSNTQGDTQTAIARGGGISNDGTLHITYSRIDNNHASAEDTTGNTAGAQPSAAGAGIFNFSAPAWDIDHSSITRNLGEATSGVTNAAAYTNAEGGGIFSQGPGTLEESTVSQNKVHAQSATASFSNHFGGVVASTGGPLNIISSTIAGNGWDTAASANFGANLMIVPAGSMTLENTIVANPLGPASTENCYGPTITSNGFNIDHDANSGTTCDTTPAATDKTADPLLAGLAFNGATTETLALAPGSPALDQGSSLVQAFDGDQRGLTRPVDLPGSANSGAVAADASDIGAYEEQPPAPPPSGGGQSPAASTGLRAAALKKCKKKKSKKARKKCKKRASKLPL
jgi:CSLREA domain-containing protein